MTRPETNVDSTFEPHESAVKHVTGAAVFVDDLPELPGQLYVATGMSTHAHAKIVKIDLSAVLESEGVVDVITYNEIPGDAEVGPIYKGDLLLANEVVEFIGQPVFAVAATSLKAAKRALEKAAIEYEPLEALITVKDAMKAASFVLPEKSFVRGDADDAISQSPHVLEGEQYVRGQEHFYLEGQTSFVLPNEDEGVVVYCSSQHPTEVQHLVAKVLDVPFHQIQVEVRRLGGGFGGKESQAAALACIAAIFARRNKLAIKFRMPRQDDMVQTGKRHDFWNRYRVGFDDNGQVQGVNMELAALCGHSPDLSEGIVDRAMFHADNSYYYDNAKITGYRCKTHTVSNTAFRGFGGPKGMIAAESMMDDIARALNLDPLDVRKANLYKPGRDVTPYGQKIEQHVLPALIDQLESSCDYRARREEIKQFNRESSHFKRGLALTPVKFGISFTSKHLNQAGALVHIYTDGSIHVNHGGTEMGQGLHTKMKQVAARVLGVSNDRVQVNATRTDKVPNTSPTAASSGTDLNGMAVRDAVNQIHSRLVKFLAGYSNCEPEDVRIENDVVHLKDQTMPFDEAVKLAYMNRVHLSAAGFYKTPKIEFDFDKGVGMPFYYFANGAAAAEVVVDTRSGEYRVMKIDILHDVGRSLNPAIDIGQIEGGFIQGMGWLTTEELLWDDTGRLVSNSPANYKIPTAYDVPEAFEVALFDEPNREDTIYQSKAVGEPPLMLALSVWCALRDACASLVDYRFSPPMNAPATSEEVFSCIQSAMARENQHD
jgi:xanthine dehydrogenase large subunit